MSYHFWRNCGRDRKRRFITLANSYHGETLGALAVGNAAPHPFRSRSAQHAAAVGGRHRDEAGARDPCQFPA
jgi:adenosylmethionine-8-amino-7-oxononanoate aminotransferase